MIRCYKTGAFAAALLTIANAGASGDLPYDRYASRYAPDIPLERYQAGELGVVLPTYARTYLYAAWRGVMLGARDLKASPGMEHGLAVSVEGRPGGYGDWRQNAPDDVYAAWRNAVSAALKREVLPTREKDNVANTYRSCPDSSYFFAAQTLNDLSRRSDATPARLQAWVATQRQVFRICGDDPEMRRPGYGQPKVVASQPAALPASEALYWRQMQEYQLASAAFYAEDYTSSGKLFAHIGATDKHPLRHWGKYLALRSQARAATYIPPSVSQEERWKQQQAMASESPEAAAARQTAQQQKVDAIQAGIDDILADAALKDLHEDARAVGRAMRAQLTPKLRFAELSKALDNPRIDPYADDQLGDWRLLADQLMPVAALRKSAGFVDWIQTIQQCHGYKPEASCEQEREHALEQWRRYVKEGNQPQARVWLMAAAMRGDAMPADLEQASLQVSADAPEYLTVRYALAHHYRVGKQADQARALEDAMLAQLGATSSPSARNLFRQERLAMVTSPAEAVPYLLRAPLEGRDGDTGEKADIKPPDLELASDGQRWLNSGLATADLYALSADQRLPAALRARIAIAAWMRFDLLGQEAGAVAAAKRIGQTAPALAADMRKYQAQTSESERRHAMLLTALKWQLTPTLNWYNATLGEFKQTPPDEVTASMWCKLPAKAGVTMMEDTAIEMAPPAPDTGNATARDKELAQLGQLKTATGFVGDHVLRRAAAVPKDPDLPWLLYVVVQSTRGGCLDADAKALSKNAFTLLGKRYGNTEWSRKTPYYY
ncbi:hypothetical protein [Duganella radicis]|uniref:Lytic transglycosylase domain-containing protein n=1 Tax=Duganella radicis TaxID=551988 RepID=A0A6L6PAV3_9BURK|nr:hypothetical protein [Duganella radicis]MTV36102.1 hypothetical protein [Duganella radicis]